MSTYEAIKTVTKLAGSAILLNRFVIQAADGFHDHSGAGADADGVSAEAQATVEGAFAMAMMNQGIMLVEAGAAVTLLSDVQSDSVGRAIDHVSSVGDYRLGKALEAAAGAGEIIRVQLKSSLDEVT